MSDLLSVLDALVNQMEQWVEIKADEPPSNASDYAEGLHHGIVHGYSDAVNRFAAELAKLRNE